jgi:hypothetical protein
MTMEIAFYRYASLCGFLCGLSTVFTAWGIYEAIQQRKMRAIIPLSLSVFLFILSIDKEELIKFCCKEKTENHIEMINFKEKWEKYREH